MDYTTSDFNGFECREFEFEGRKAAIVLPEKPQNGKWLLKTEYFYAFPGFEIEMLKRGWCLAYLANITRWFKPDDADSKARFCDFLSENYGLDKKCLPVGMSCGGMHAVYFAAKYPEHIAALYLDAPVLNLLSCPAGIGLAGDSMLEEFINDTGMSVSSLINYRNHPIDHVDELIQNHIPVFLICGDSDTTVPFVENGAVLLEKYKAAGAEIDYILKLGCDHHPHGLGDDNGPLIDFAEKHCK